MTAVGVDVAICNEAAWMSANAASATGIDSMPAEQADYEWAYPAGAHALMQTRINPSVG